MWFLLLFVVLFRFVIEWETTRSEAKRLSALIRANTFLRFFWFYFIVIFVGCRNWVVSIHVLLRLDWLNFIDFVSKMLFTFLRVFSLYFCSFDHSVHSIEDEKEKLNTRTRKRKERERQERKNFANENLLMAFSVCNVCASNKFILTACCYHDKRAHSHTLKHSNELCKINARSPHKPRLCHCAHHHFLNYRHEFNIIYNTQNEHVERYQENGTRRKKTTWKHHNVSAWMRSMARARSREIVYKNCTDRKIKINLVRKTHPEKDEWSKW